MTILFLASIFPSGFASAQSKVTESINGNSYLIDLKFENTECNIININGQKVLHFDGLDDESVPSGFILPSKDLFIAIPYKTLPKVKLTVVSQTEFPCLPEIKNNTAGQEGIFSSKDNVLNSKDPNTSTNYKVKGFLWIGNNYCMHLTVFPYRIDPVKRITYWSSEISIEMIFKEQLPSKVPGKSYQKNVAANILNKELAAIVENKPEYCVSGDDSWIDYSKTYLKVGTATDGIYKITYDDLNKFGIDVNLIDVATFQLWQRGKQLPIYISGETQGKLNQNGYIEFIGTRNMGGNHRIVNTPGTPYNEYLGRYTDTSVYWLTWGGANGERVRVINGNEAISVRDTIEYYNEVIHLEDNPWFDFSMADLVKRESPFWIDNKTWIANQIGVGAANIGFTVSDVYPDKSLKLFTKLQDFASDINSKAHLLSLSLNSNTQVFDSGYINKYEQKVLTADINSNYLKSGSNNLIIHSYPTAASLNSCVLDWNEIEYPRFIKLNNNSLVFSFPFISSPAIKCVKIQNVTSNAISFWKFSDTYKRFEVQRANNNIFINDSLNSSSRYIIADSAKILKPFFYYVRKFRNLRDKNNTAEYITITHQALKKKANEYTNFISQAYKLKSTLVTCDEIYDEFDYGYFNPESIREFLKITQLNWQDPKPKYILLLGKANYDYYKNKQKYFNAPGVPNYVPSFGIPCSDNWFAIWDSTGANYPQLNIGRLPVKNNEELEYYLQKHKNYLARPYDDWNKKYLFFSGGNFTDQSQIAQFKTVNDNIINSYVIPGPIGGIAHHFYKTVNPISNFGPYPQEEINSVIEDGSLFISYLGHSGTQTWDNSITDPTQLNNKNGSPLITDFGCSTARFAEPDIQSFAELFVNGLNGQAIAYIGNASLGFTSTALTFPSIFYSTILTDSVYNIAEALRGAKMKMLQRYGSTGVYSNFSLTNTLIGDPIISLPIPKLPNLSITQKEISMGQKTIDDQTDSVIFKVKYFNLGRVTKDSVKIKIKDEFQNQSVYERNIIKIIPNYYDSISVSIPVKSRAGEHKLSVILDYPSTVPELSKTDNSIDIRYTVVSTALRSLLTYQLESQTDKITFLNPTANTGKSESFDFQINQTGNFNGELTRTVGFDPFFTKFKPDSMRQNERYWFRVKLHDNPIYNNTQSFVTGEAIKYSITDSMGFAMLQNNNIKVFKGKAYLDTAKIDFRVISAGFNDGNMAVIEKNSQNFIPENTLQGHHVSLFDGRTFDFKGYYRFNIFSGGTQETTNYIKLLDTLSSNYIVIIAVSDEGTVNSPDLKKQIKSIGSKYVDSLQFRGSWAIIGRKGAQQGSVPEMFKNPFQGRAVAEQSFFKSLDKGYLLTEEIGRAGKWKNIIVRQGNQPASSVSTKIIGIKDDGKVDTLKQYPQTNEFIDISNINPKLYPKLKLKIEFNLSANGSSPILNSFGVNYNSLAELGTNYQVVSTPIDTVQRGESIGLNFFVYNAGESKADSFKVKVEVIKPDNSRETIYQTLVDSISAEGKKQFQVTYNTSQSHGPRSFYISIDPENKIDELYKDNNYYSIPFYISPDTTRPSLKVTFDGNDIMDGEYISSKPNIKVELSDNSFLPITDSSSVKLLLNNKPVYYSSAADLHINYSASNPKVVVNYSPQLADGEYTLKVLGKNTAGNLADSSGITRYFQVVNDLKLIDLYNYPNPCRGETYFTFKLTQIPDEMRIKIFTVAGRLVRDITVSPSDLRFDFNRVYWDGRDQDGDLLANGVYLYKVIIRDGDKSHDYLQRIAIVR